MATSESVTIYPAAGQNWFQRSYATDDLVVDGKDAAAGWIHIRMGCFGGAATD